MIDESLAATPSSSWLPAILPTIGEFGVVTALRELLRRPCDYPVHIWGASISGREMGTLHEEEYRLPASGAGMRRGQAVRAALAEAVERYAFGKIPSPSMLTDPPNDLQGSAEELGRLPLFRSPEASDVSEISERLNENREWVRLKAWNTADDRGNFIYLPASCVFGALSMPSAPANTNGMAAGVTTDSAVLSGLYEIVERDAFMISWYHRFPGTRIDEGCLLPQKVLSWIKRLRDLNVDFRIHDISTNLGFYVFLGYVVAVDGGRPVSFSCGAGCRINAYEAALHAFLEAAMSWRGVSELVSMRGLLDEKEISGFSPRSFTDHMYLYHHPQVLGSVDFLLEQEPVFGHYEGERYEAKTEYEIRDAVTRLEDHGFHTFFVDVTPPEVQHLGLKVTRTWVPGLVPLAWSYYHPLPTARLLNPKHIPPLVRRTDLNTDPHPFP